MEGVFIPFYRPYSNLSENDLIDIIIPKKNYFNTQLKRSDAANELNLRKEILKKINKK